MRPRRAARPAVSRSSLAGPGLRNLSPASDVVHNKNQLMVVVAVENFDIDAGFGHPAREQAELAGDILLEALDEDFPFLDEADARGFKSPGERRCRLRRGNERCPGR